MVRGKDPLPDKSRIVVVILVMIFVVGIVPGV